MSREIDVTQDIFLKLRRINLTKKNDLCGYDTLSQYTKAGSVWDNFIYLDQAQGNKIIKHFVKFLNQLILNDCIKLYK